MSVQPMLKRGLKALEGWEWREARAAFEEVVAVEESAEALEGLAIAAAWLDDAAASIEARERAFRAYRDRGDVEAAARVAGGLADALLTFRGESAVAAGWLQRARRVLAERPDSAVLVWIDVVEAFLTMAYERDVPRAIELGESAVARARRLGDVGFEAVALSVLGVVLVSVGRFEEGMRLLDEATASVAAGDVKDPEAAANVCCALVTASVRVRDFDRLAQWSRYVMEFSRDWPNRAMFSYPRIEHAVALTWWGRWQEAERELEDAIADMDGRPLLSALAMLRLADLRRRQGRFGEAWTLLERLGERPGGVGMGHLIDAVRAAVALDRADPSKAAALAERFLRMVPPDDIVERVDGLEVLSRARAALGDAKAAADAAAELSRTADRVPTQPFRALACLASGLAARTRGDDEDALQALEEARGLYERSDAPFEAARAHVEVGHVLLALGQVDAAVEEMQQAANVFEVLGATADAQSVQAELDALPSRARGERKDLPLTARELEVLTLVASGRSNEEIAAALVLSVRTVERHISNIYAKIGARGSTARAVATAYAHTHALT